MKQDKKIMPLKKKHTVQYFYICAIFKFEKPI